MGHPGRRGEPGPPAAYTGNEDPGIRGPPGHPVKVFSVYHDE